MQDQAAAVEQNTTWAAATWAAAATRDKLGSNIMSVTAIIRRTNPDNTFYDFVQIVAGIGTSLGFTFTDYPGAAGNYTYSIIGFIGDTANPTLTPYDTLAWANAGLTAIVVKK
jgi:hypothetical protein